jgi:hypothetical protein
MRAAARRVLIGFEHRMTASRGKNLLILLKAPDP